MGLKSILERIAGEKASARAASSATYRDLLLANAERDLKPAEVTRLTQLIEGLKLTPEQVLADEQKIAEMLALQTLAQRVDEAQIEYDDSFAEQAKAFEGRQQAYLECNARVSAAVGRHDAAIDFVTRARAAGGQLIKLLEANPRLA